MRGVWGVVALCSVSLLVVGSVWVSQSRGSSPTAKLNPQKSTALRTERMVHSSGTALVATKMPNTKPKKKVSPYPILTPNSKSNAVLRLQEVLSAMGYLPVAFKPHQAIKETGSNQLQLLKSPPAGGWVWKYKATPSTLKQFWAPGVYTVLTEGAVMHYQAVKHLAVDGVAGPDVWSHLLSDYLAGRRNPDGYSYVYTSKSYPETLQIWKNGKYVLKSLVNTGVPGASTPSGTWPIYLRFASQTMSGHTPSGQYYSDPGVPWVNYFYKGCAIHGFYRAGYGYPQSLGCIEMPVQESALAWNELSYGTLVTVS